jgi:hypothetical protein
MLYPSQYGIRLIHHMARTAFGLLLIRRSFGPKYVRHLQRKSGHPVDFPAFEIGQASTCLVHKV